MTSGTGRSPRRFLCVYQHAPTPGAPGIYRNRLELAELVRRGWQVDLISTPRNYMTGELPDRYRGRTYVRETIDGIGHHWVWASGRIHTSRRRRAANYASFAVMSAVRAAMLRRPDVILCSSPPLSVGALGPLLARRFRRPWLLEVRDIWPESVASVGWLREGSLPYRALDLLSRRLAQASGVVVVPTPGLVEWVTAHGARRVVVVPGAVVDNPPDPVRRAAMRARLGLRDECVFLYLGAIGVANGLDVLLDAVRLLPRDAPAAFVVVGDGSARAELAQRARAEGLDSVRLLDAVPKNAVADYLAAADVGLHLLRDSPVFESALPSKVLEYFGAHLPFVTTVSGLPEQLAQASGGGCAKTAEALAVEVERWLRMEPVERRAKGEAAYRLGAARFGLGDAVDRLEELLEETIARRRGTRRYGLLP